MILYWQTKNKLNSKQKDKFFTQQDHELINDTIQNVVIRV